MILIVLLTVEKLATDCAEQSNSPLVVGYLYSYYILNNQWDSVKQLLQVSLSLLGMTENCNHTE